MFPPHLENQMSHAPVTYHRMDVLPEAKACYYTDTVSYAGIWKKRASYHQVCLFLKFPRYESSKSLIRKNIEKHLSALY